MRSYDDQSSDTVDELRRLRRAAPEPERRLLRALRESFPRLKWRHQSPIGPVKPDLLCFSQRLVIEVDGDTHGATEKRDANRTRFIQRQGYRVLRFNNTDVMQDLEGEIEHISLSLRERQGGAKRRKGEGDATSNSPSPRGASAPCPSPDGRGA